jgi:transcriptional antiterminator RfaH
MWYVIYTKRDQEKRALENLERQGFSCYLPRLRLQKLKRGAVAQVEEPLFPRYLFVQLDPEKGWGTLRSTRGVTRLVSFGADPAPVPPLLIERLRQEERTASILPMFREGDGVRITSGSFSGVKGIFLMQDGDTRALVLIQLLQQPAKLQIELDRLHYSSD